MWKQGYRGVMYCNYAIEGIGNSEIDGEKRNTLVAEAKILRAFYYYILTCTFGDVPYYTVDVATKEILKRVQRLPRTSAVEIRSNIIADLEPVVPTLDQIRGSDEPGNRVGAALGWMMIAKLAMWNGSKDVGRPTCGGARQSRLSNRCATSTVLCRLSARRELRVVEEEYPRIRLRNPAYIYPRRRELHFVGRRCGASVAHDRYDGL